jgi:hypothetical protein
VLHAERVTRAIQEGWLAIESAGGSGEVPKIARNKATNFRRLKRIAVFLDSDRWLPRQQMKAHGHADKLAKDGIITHVLEFREAENYVPNQVLSRIRGRPGNISQRITYLKRLNREQRAYFDMKKGFSGERIRTEQASLYADLRRDVIHGLREGFGDDLLPLLERESYALTERDFTALGNDVVGELHGLLAMLASVI